MTALLSHGESTVKRLGHLRHRRLSDGAFENAQAVTVQEIQSIDR
ncbi:MULTISPECIES: hypothetical protein [Streptomyces]|nr:hypothetical protein [Streptomyces sp. RS2]MCW1095747.1 hypothetical protein [Streptomyces sp. RS2]